MAELTQNEKRLLAVLAREKAADEQHLAAHLDATPEAVVQWAHLAMDNGAAKVERIVETGFIYTEEGEKYLNDGLPETRLLAAIGSGTTLADLQKHAAFKIGFGQLRKKGLVVVGEGNVTTAPGASTADDEAALRSPLAGGAKVKELMKRGLLQETEAVRYRIAITPAGESLVKKGLDLREEIGTLTREQILSGSWKNANFRKYDIQKLPKNAYPGKIHPYQRIIAEMREILLDMGFSELYGGIVQQSYWNFDALFQPQDHPAREMQDTFYLN